MAAAAPETGLETRLVASGGSKKRGQRVRDSEQSSGLVREKLEKPVASRFEIAFIWAGYVALLP